MGAAYAATVKNNVPIRPNTIVGPPQYEYPENAASIKNNNPVPQITRNASNGTVSPSPKYVLLNGACVGADETVDIHSNKRIVIIIYLI